MYWRSKVEYFSQVLHFGHKFEMPVRQSSGDIRQTLVHLYLEFREANCWRPSREGSRVGTSEIRKPGEVGNHREESVSGKSKWSSMSNAAKFRGKACDLT